jgi:dipeptidyl-peptidase 4
VNLFPPIGGSEGEDAMHRRNAEVRGVGFVRACAAAGIVLAAGHASAFQPARASEPTTAPSANQSGAADASRDDGRFLRDWAATRGFSLGRPRSITVTPTGDAVLFLRSEPRSFVHNLYSLNPATGEETVLLTAEKLLGNREERLTPEERARRERSRQANRGIVSYQLSEDGGTIVVPLSDQVFLFDRASGKIGSVPFRGQNNLDPRLSRSGKVLGWVRENQVRVMPLELGQELSITEFSDDFITNGVSEFVAQEEMGRFEGFWISPDDMHIVYQQNDHAGVERLTIADPMKPESGAQNPFYPRAGKKNVDVSLHVAVIGTAERNVIRWDVGTFPYLAGVKWGENSPITLLVQNREQTRQQLLAADHTTGKTWTLLEEKDDAWLNIEQSVPRWFDDGSHFLWISESSGEARLELRTNTGSLVHEVTPKGFGFRGLISLDEKNATAYVNASAEPTENHVWRVPLDPAKGSPERLTTEPGVYGATFGKDHSVYVLSSNTMAGEISSVVKRADGTTIVELKSVAEKPPFTPDYQIVTLPGEHRFRASIVRPRDFDPAKKYPVLLNVYGGPTAQVVTAARQGQLLKQWYADRGFIVVASDNRGTPGRDRAWERVTKGNFIDIPLEDQITALRQLAQKVPQMDLDRVGIWGWSFGGYFSAMAAMRHPEVFKAAVAGAPVADFADYDTHYTERYLGLPKANPKGYEASNVLTYAKDLRVPLLIVHGTADDNVYFMHALKMADALFKAGRDFDFLPLSGFTHMVPDPVVKERLETRVLDFFETHLGQPTPADGATSGGK